MSKCHMVRPFEMVIYRNNFEYILFLQVINQNIL